MNKCRRVQKESVVEMKTMQINVNILYSCASRHIQLRLPPNLLFLLRSHNLPLEYHPPHMHIHSPNGETDAQQSEMT